MDARIMGLTKAVMEPVPVMGTELLLRIASRTLRRLCMSGFLSGTGKSGRGWRDVFGVF